MKKPIIYFETVTSKTDNTCLFPSGQKYMPLWLLYSRLTKLTTCENKKLVKHEESPCLENIVREICSYMRVVCHAKKAERTNSTFGFCRHTSKC